MTAPNPIRLLRRAIARSGYSNRRYAELVLGVNERTVRRWLSVKIAVNPEIIQRLRAEERALRAAKKAVR